MRINTVNDYVEELSKRFPEINKSDIKRILTYCWKMIYLYNSLGNDTIVRFPDLLFFIGNLTNDPLSNFNVYIRKLRRKIRFMFIRNKELWDGYYYFALTEKQFADYLKLNNKKFKIFKYIKLFKLLDECKVHYWNRPYIFRVKEDVCEKFTKWVDEYKTKDAEFILERDPMNILDLMDLNKNCKYL